jgi:hypothetical protein
VPGDALSCSEISAVRETFRETVSVSPEPRLGVVPPCLAAGFTERGHDQLRSARVCSAWKAVVRPFGPGGCRTPETRSRFLWPSNKELVPRRRRPSVRNLAQRLFGAWGCPSARARGLGPSPRTAVLESALYNRAKTEERYRSEAKWIPASTTAGHRLAQLTCTAKPTFIGSPGERVRGTPGQGVDSRSGCAVEPPDG